MKSPLQRLYQTKLALLATISTVVGFALLALSHWVSLGSGWVTFKELVNDVGANLFGIGLLGVFFQYIGTEDQEKEYDSRVRRMLKETAPDMRDAVVEGFAFAPEALTNVASPATLDRIIENCLTIQLGDRELASDTYTGLREQIFRSKARRRDTRVSVTLSPWEKGPVSGPGAMFVATIKWEYRLVPDGSVMRFSCVSDLDEYRVLLQDPTSTIVWYFQPVAGLDGASEEAFQLLQFTVDGRSRPARRTSRANSQTFMVNMGSEITAAPQPKVTQLSASDLTPSVEVSFDGWVFPKGGVAFVWVLESELSTVGRRRKSGAGRSRSDDQGHAPVAAS